MNPDLRRGASTRGEGVDNARKVVDGAHVGGTKRCRQVEGLEPLGGKVLEGTGKSRALQGKAVLLVDRDGGKADAEDLSSLLGAGMGAGAAQGGKRCPLKYTRAILDAVHSGELAKVEYENYDVFNLQVPKTCPGVPSELLNPAKAWTAGADSFKDEVQKLGKLFNENFKKFESEATEDVIKAGPVV